MPRIVVAALLAAAVAAPAAADPPADTTVAGGCQHESVRVPDGVGGSQPRYAGAVSGRVAAFSPTLAHNPVTVVSLTCELRVNGAVVAAVTRAGAGPVAVVEPTPVGYHAFDLDPVELCTTVETVDAHGQRQTVSDACRHGDPQLPPSWIWGPVDAALCPALQALAPVQVGAHLLVEPDGDVHVGGELFWDSPPYEW